MSRSTLKAFILFTFLITWIIPHEIFAQEKAPAVNNMSHIENYQEQIRRLMGFLEFSLNTLGGSDASTREKEIIINESYEKAFLNEKVQVEDDLDENRDVLTYKDVQAYLKDVDFFFKEAAFTFDVQEIQNLVNENGMTYFKVTANRNLQAVTVDDQVINNNKTRYIEINLDEEEQVLKIASIYTTRLNEAQELMTWWNNMPSGWKTFLGSGYMLTDELSLNQIDFLDDTTFLLFKEVPAIVKYESYVFIGNDSLLVIQTDTVLRKIYDTIPAGKNSGLRILKEITKQQNLDVSSYSDVFDLYPVDQMTDLNSLNISNTMITDLFPARNLTKLASLNISGTTINDLSPIRYNTRIRELYLDSTLVTSLSPIRNFTELEVLHIRNTPIDSLHYIKIFSLLKDLRIDETPVSDLSALGDLTSLQNLSMVGTGIDSLTSVQYLITLKRINFERTNINDLGPLSLLDSLQVIDADQTQISNLEPLSGINSLQKVYCDQTLVNRTTANAFMTANPGVLIIYESQELTSWWAGLTPEWKVVIREYATLDSLPSTEQLHQLTMISLIDITNNKGISDLGPLSKITNLKELRAGGTNISDLFPMKEVIDLKVLICPDTRISDLLPLRDLLNLEKLDISGTPADTLDGLNNLSKLQVLLIDRTRVGNLSPIAGCRNLSFIYCDNTRIGKVDIDRFADEHPNCLIVYQTGLLKTWWNALASAWKSAFREHTQLDETPTREQLHILAGLKKIGLDGNRGITSLEPLTTLHRLEELSIANGALQDISPLQNLVRLWKLNLSGNPVSDFTPLSQLPSLSDLDISNTALAKLDFVKTIDSMERLNCSGTQIKKLDPVGYLSKLKKLECYNTEINNLKPLLELSQLRHLVCYNTKLASKKVEAFKESRPEVEVVYY